MLSDIVTALGLNDICTVQKLIVATKDVNSDLNFIFSEILSFYIKRDYFVILLNLAQSSNHYNHLLLKSGVNMRQLRDQGKLIILDILSEIENVTICEKSQNATLRPVFSDFLGVDCLKELYLRIKKSVETLKSTDKSKNYVIFIDEISILLNLGVNLNAIEPFVQYCVSLCTETTSNPNILLLGSTYEKHDSQNAKLVNFLLHLSDIRIQVEGLKTGYSKDAHGKIILSVENKEACTSSHQKLLFKVTEKGAKLLTLGL